MASRGGSEVDGAAEVTGVETRGAVAVGDGRHLADPLDFFAFHPRSSRSLGLPSSLSKVVKLFCPAAVHRHHDTSIFILFFFFQNRGNV